MGKEKCADWICGLIGRLMALSVAPEEFQDWGDFKKYFSSRIAAVAIPCSGLEYQNGAEQPLSDTGELIDKKPKDALKLLPARGPVVGQYRDQGTIQPCWSSLAELPAADPDFLNERTDIIDDDSRFNG